MKNIFNILIFATCVFAADERDQVSSQLSRLPQNILSKVSSYLDPDDLSSFAQTKKGYCDLIQEILNRGSRTEDGNIVLTGHISGIPLVVFGVINFERGLILPPNKKQIEHVIKRHAPFIAALYANSLFPTLCYGIVSGLVEGKYDFGEDSKRTFKITLLLKLAKLGWEDAQMYVAQDLE